MKIAIYANELALPGQRGVKTYSREIIKELLKVDTLNEYVLCASRDIIDEVEAGSNVRMLSRNSRQRFWAFRTFPKLVAEAAPDVVFLPIQTFPFFRRGVHKTKIVTMIHDLAFLKYPENFTMGRKLLLTYHTRRAVALSDQLIAPSQSTKRDILAAYGVDAEKVAVIMHGSSDKFAKSTSGEGYTQSLVADNPYMLFVGTIQPRKNIEKLVEAFELLRRQEDFQQIKLVICGGKGWQCEETLKRIQESPQKGDILLTGAVEDDQLANLYKQARLFVMPSLYEGFGLPVLEAMSCGVPILVADNSSLREIVEDSGLLFNAFVASDMAAKMGQVLSDDQLRLDLAQKSLKRASDFSWQGSARETLSVLEQVDK
jgi:glycosyltransferase involved in cell wall biosynthesis